MILVWTGFSARNSMVCIFSTADSDNEGTELCNTELNFAPLQDERRVCQTGFALFSQPVNFLSKPAGLCNRCTEGISLKGCEVISLTFPMVTDFPVYPQETFLVCQLVTFEIRPEVCQVVRCMELQQP